MGVRWWLGAAFAVVAAVSTAIVVSQYSSRSENSLRVNAQDAAAKSTAVAAALLGSRPTTAANLATVERRTGLRLGVYDARGRLVVGSSSTKTGPGIFVVRRPFRGGTLVAQDTRPDVAAAFAILNDQALKAGLIAGLIGVAVGLLLAQLIALRLRRLSSAAEAIALGNFEAPLRHRFPDEFGALAQSFERMRRQLRRSFRRLEGERDRLRMLLERLHEGVVLVD